MTGVQRLQAASHSPSSTDGPHHQKEEGERGSRQRTRRTCTHLLPEPQTHVENEVGEGRREQRPVWHRPANACWALSYWEEHICSWERQGENPCVSSGLLSLDREAWLPRGGVWECAFLAGWAGVADLGPPCEKRNPTPIPNDFRDAHLWEFLKAWDQAREAADKSHWLSGLGKFVLSHVGMNFCPLSRQLLGQYYHRISLLQENAMTRAIQKRLECLL